MLELFNKAKKGIKIFLGCTILIEISIILSSFFLGGLAKYICEASDMVLKDKGIYYTAESLFRSMNMALVMIVVIIFRKKDRRMNFYNFLEKKYNYFSLVHLFILNFLFSFFIYLGNNFLRNFDNFNNNLNKKYGE